MHNDGVMADRRVASIAFAVVLVAGAILRLRGLGAHGLWTDELVSFWAASAESVADLAHRVSECMATPPLSFVAERASLTVLGRSEWSLRLPSVLAGILAIAVVFLAGRRMLGGEAALVAATVLATQPFHIGFSTDARPYAIAGLAALLSTWAWSEMAERPRRAWIVLHVLTSAALLYTQFVFAPLLVAQVAAYLLGRRRGMAQALRPKVVLADLAATIVLCLPLLPQILGVAGRASSLAWSATEEYPPWIYWFFQTTPLGCALLVGLVLRLALGPGNAVPRDPGEASPREGFDALSLSLSFLIPSLLVGIAAVTLRLPSLVKTRYGAAYLGICALLVGYLFTRLRAGLPRRVTAATYLLLVLLTQVAPPLIGGRSFSVDADLEGWNDAAAVLRDEAAPADAILLRSPLVETADLFAGKLPSGCAGYLASPLGGFYLPAGPEVVLLPPEIAGPPYPAVYGPRIGARIAGRERIWLVMAGAPDPDGYAGAVLALAGAASGRPYAVASVRSFGLVSMALLRRGS